LKETLQTLVLLLVCGVQTHGIAAVPGHGQHSSQEWLLLLEVPGQLVRENTSQGFFLDEFKASQA